MTFLFCSLLLSIAYKTNDDLAQQAVEFYARVADGKEVIGTVITWHSVCGSYGNTEEARIPTPESSNKSWRSVVSL